jgi:plastocyanin
MKRCTSLLCAAIAAGAAAAIPAGAFGGASAAGTHTVTLQNIRFHPPTLKIHRGETVRWLWRDGGTEHNVTFHGFHSRTQGSGSYSVRFNRAGTYSYRCTIHASEGMTGKVIVH